MWFVDRAGKAVGPIDSTEWERLAARGDILSDTSVWQEGWPDWRPARDIFPQLRVARPNPPPPRMALRQPNSQAPVMGAAAERLVTSAHHSIARSLAVYGPLAGALSTLADFVKPVIELTRPITIGAIILAGLLWAAAHAAPALRDRLLVLSRFCILLFTCSAAWWGLQAFVPQAGGGGALVEIVPGAGILQDTLLKSMQGVEKQTKRVGDLLETQAREAREAEAAWKREQEAHEKRRIEGERKTILAAGYTADAAGFAKAVAENFGRTSAFEAINIELTAEAITKGLREVRDLEQARALTSFTARENDRLAYLRPVDQALFEDGNRLRQAFKDRNARQFVCDKRNVKIPAGDRILAEVCRQEGRMFAAKYADYFSHIYAPIG